MKTHGEIRLKQRVGKCINKRTILLARQRGIKRSQYNGSFRRYLDKIYFKNNFDIIIYGNFIYLFDKTFLVTVLPIPSKYLKYGGKKYE